MHHTIAHPEKHADEVSIRVTTAAVLLPPVLLAAWYGAPIWPLLLAVAGVLCAAEYHRIALGHLPRETWPALLAAAAIPLLPEVFGSSAPAAAFWLLSAASIAAWLVGLSRGRPERCTERVGQALAGLLFAAPGLFALAWLRTADGGQGWTLAVLIVTWSNDAGAYAIGRACGRHPLAPRVSPGKTWEGLMGGLICSFPVTMLVWLGLLPGAGAIEIAVLGLGTALVGPMGDLAKSLVKRAHGVKDSSHLLPGHGGMLDRIDALLWNSVLVVAVRAVL